MDDFDSIVAGLEEELDLDTEDVVDMTTLSIKELLDIATSTEENLLDRLEAVRPRSQWGRDQHSLREAARLELKRRQK